ncbi:MAG: hypothetical protein P8X42_06775 [Calditrichaceae bacterium]|jgi:hypothetical protein
MDAKKPEISKKRKRWFLAITLTILLLLALITSEIFLRSYMGLGNPVLYQSSPLYGYRPQPNQHVTRFYGSEIRINNLGLRAQSDWDKNPENKVLFLGNSVTYGGSYIDNKDLFTTWAIKDLPGYHGGNAGVNGWGIGNIKALVADLEFLPAKTYVSVLQEMDFYRGLSKLAGKPFWAHKPHFAWQEILYFFFYDRTQTIYKGHDRFVTEREKELTVIRSVKKLIELDKYLRSHNFNHLIYISPNKPQLLGERDVDPYVKKYLAESGLHVQYLKDRDRIKALSKDEILAVYHDFSHLSKEGHHLWGELFGHDLAELFAQNNQQKTQD